MKIADRMVLEESVENAGDSSFSSTFDSDPVIAMGNKHYRSSDAHLFYRL